MSYARTFDDYTPAARAAGSGSWLTAQINEAPLTTAPPDLGDPAWTTIDTLTLTPADSDPTIPQTRTFTTENAQLANAWYQVIFLDAVNAQDITDPISVTTIEAGVYTTSSALRAYLNLDSTTLPDDKASELIASAEDVVDTLLGAWPVNFTTGRKIQQANILGWQWEKLGRATVKVAAAIYTNPETVTRQRYKSVSGPDFRFDGPLNSGFGDLVIVLLNATGLRRLTAKATGRTGQTEYGVVGSLPVANGPDDPDDLGDQTGADYGPEWP